MLNCFSLQYFIKYIIPSHALVEAKKLICHSEIHLARIHDALLGSRIYIIYWEVLQLLSSRFSLGTDATGIMSVKCWVGLSLSGSATPASAFLQEGKNKEIKEKKKNNNNNRKTTLKLDNSSPRFYFEVYVSFQSLGIPVHGKGLGLDDL